MRLNRSRKADPTSTLSSAEIKAYRTAIAQIQCLARESRPDVAGGASLQSAALPHPLVSDATLVNELCAQQKATASQKITSWPLDPLSLTFVTVSDAGRPGSARRHRAQGAWLILAADASIRNNLRARVPLLSWRSQRIERAVASTGAAETLSLSSAVAEAQWLQAAWRDLMFHDVQVPDWASSQSPFSVVLSKDCVLAQDVSTVSVVDAKSIFDTLSRNCAGSRADRRNAIEVAVLRDSMSSIGSQIRWIPHGRMAADPVTKADPGPVRPA
ncbi:unnamed protein product [Prorocentrum cordatum]|uniref:Pyridoxal 5'-phosphate synthase n=1 Tax=Prorocentrum cordatum TaxID=2364126 RepID=A0ABN9TGU2_9DINO|nr:unnamed protein product [Polarella glacialis]